MQVAFDFGVSDEFRLVHRRLLHWHGIITDRQRLPPTAQLVRAMIGSKTLDDVSWQTFWPLMEQFSLHELAHAPVEDVTAAIAAVHHADRKAAQIGRALRIVERRQSDLSLDFLGEMSVPEALDWLHRLPGVGPKVAAATLNFSTLKKAAFVIDSHVLRILTRLGLIPDTQDIGKAFAASMSELSDWSASDLRTLHVAMKRLGQTMCRPARPLCHDCPIAGLCGFHRSVATEQPKQRFRTDRRRRRGRSSR